MKLSKQTYRSVPRRNKKAEGKVKNVLLLYEYVKGKEETIYLSSEENFKRFCSYVPFLKVMQS